MFESVVSIGRLRVAAGVVWLEQSRPNRTEGVFDTCTNFLKLFIHAVGGSKRPMSRYKDQGIRQCSI